MIQMTNGVYGTKHEMKKAGDGPFSLSAAEEARLVARGVAKYVGELPVQQDDTTNEGKPLEEMSLAELRALGKEYGLTFRVGLTKAAMAEAIRAEIEKEQDAPDEDSAPDGAEEPGEQPDEEQPDEEAPTFDPAEAVQ